MDIVELTPRLHMISLPWQVYLLADSDGLTLVDTGIPGSAPLIADAIRSLGHAPEDLHRVVLTHFHEDHVGSAADIAAWGDVEVLAHRADAPFISGELTGPPPILLDWELPHFERARSMVEAAGPVAPVPVDHELDDGDVLDFGGGALAMAVPGHTPGSVAIYLPEPRVLFTGDTIARMEDGEVILGVFNVDREQAIASFLRQAALDVDIVCFGHGQPLVSDASARLRSVADRLVEKGF